MKEQQGPVRICIIGAGVVGQATGKGFLAKGFSVVFVDVKRHVVQTLRSQGYTACTVDELVVHGRSSDIVFLTVPTPTEEGRINLSPLHRAATDVGGYLLTHAPSALVVVRSTVPPGTTEELVIPALEAASGKKAGRDFGVCMNPEYLREATAVEDFAKPWVIVIGEYDRTSGSRLFAVYRDFGCPVTRVTLREAEMQKYVHNLFNATKIVFFNEMRSVAQGSGVDPDIIFPLVADSAEGMWNPRYGIRDLGPFDGSCLPKDTEAFRAWARDRGLNVALLDAVIRENALFQSGVVQTHAESLAPEHAVVSAASRHA